jgi:DNA-binding CsgD family transcriptional regulator/tetratricopeptide (TPR) repeat protein
MGSLWFFWIHHRTPGEARLWLTRALAAAPQERSAPLGKALLALGSLEWRQADYPAARAHLEQSATILEEIGDLAGLADASHFAGHVLFDARDFAGAQRLYETSRSAYERAGDLIGGLPLIGDLGMVAYHQGDYATARALFEACLERCRHHGATTHAAESLNRLGDLARLAGDLDQAQALYAESQALEQSINSAPGLASARHKLAQVARRTGRTTDAARLLGEALELQRELGNRQGILECLVALAGLALDWAPPEQAAELLSAAETAFAGQGILLAPADYADFEHDLVRARANLTPAAWAAAQQRGCRLDPDQALSMALAGPAPVKAASGTSEAGPLSPRETEVAALVARGLSNREIAAALVITEGTAANHVEHIMTKLDLRSRAQVAVWAVRNGLAEGG